MTPIPSQTRRQKESCNLKKSIRENPRSEVDLVDSGHVILEVHDMVKNHPLSFAYRVVADNLLLSWLLAQVNVLDIATCLRRA
jgi:hypothetical protein